MAGKFETLAALRLRRLRQMRNVRKEMSVSTLAGGCTLDRSVVTRATAR